MLPLILKLVIGYQTQLKTNFNTPINLYLRKPKGVLQTIMRYWHYRLCQLKTTSKNKIFYVF